jgi:phenylalanyl-tRNA synthetase alpha chain
MATRGLIINRVSPITIANVGNHRSSHFSTLTTSNEKDNKNCNNSNNKNTHQTPEVSESSDTTTASTSSKSSPASSSSSSPLYDFTSEECNIPLQIQQQIGRNLYLQPNHPLCIVQEQIAYYFNHILPSNHHSNNTSSESIRSAFQKERGEGIANDHILNEVYEKEYHPPQQSSSSSYFTVHDNIAPVVSTEECFDQLLIDIYHPSRHKSDTYYLNNNTVLRPHTSAHQISLIRQSVLSVNEKTVKNVVDRDASQNEKNIDKTNTDTNTNTTVQFLCVGDVYRRDEIDKSHYPIFHQMEGVKLFHIPNIRSYSDPQYKMVLDYIQFDLKQTLEGMIRYLFAQKNVTNIPMRWRDDAFPFTDPSFELDIYYNNEWMEILGCGLIRYEIIENVNYDYYRPDDEPRKAWNDIANTVQNETHVSQNILDYHTHKGWAFGIGLERLAMILFQIPDIRLFWTDDERFHQQFRTGDIRTIPHFQPYSKYPPCLKDISFWIRNYDQYHSNDTYEIIRGIGGDLIERVELMDKYTRIHKKDIELSKVSHCYRITYRSMDRSLTNAEIDAVQEQIRHEVVRQLKVELR